MLIGVVALRVLASRFAGFEAPLYYIKRGKVSVRNVRTCDVTVGVASSMASDVTVRMTS